MVVVQLPSCTAGRGERKDINCTYDVEFGGFHYCELILYSLVPPTRGPTWFTYEVNNADGSGPLVIIR